MNLVLLSGTPASGKSHFGGWLTDTHDFLHLDVEKPGYLDAYGLVPAWNGCFSALGVDQFVAALRRLKKPVLVNWGFPPRWLSVVQRLKAAGAVPWWFDADHEAAKRAFAFRGDVPMVAFDAQMAAIRAAWSSIESTFSPNILSTLAADGTRVPPEVIYETMLGVTKDRERSGI